MNFSSNFFLKVGLIGCFRELNVRKFRKFSPDHFYDTENRFYDKKTDFRPETRESMTSETTWESMASETTRESMASETTATRELERPTSGKCSLRNLAWLEFST